MESSGPGIGANANLTALAIGTETSGSILSPANANGIAGIKPTVGLVSRDRIIPITQFLDRGALKGARLAVDSPPTPLAPNRLAIIDNAPTCRR
jgi:hypothetical protein